MHAPSRDDTLVAALSEAVGGPLGDHAAPPHRWTERRLSLGLTALSVLAGLGLAALVGSAPGSPAQVAGATAVALLVTVLLTGIAPSGHPPLPWRGAGWAAAPLLVLHGQEWALLAAGGLALSTWAVLRPGFVLALAPAGLALTAWLVGDHLVTARPGQGSSWLLVEQVLDRRLPGGVWLGVAAGCALAGMAFAAFVARRAGHPAVRVAAVALVLVATGLLVLPTAPPETSLLLLPLAALVVRRWSDLLAWQGCEVVSWLLTQWYLAGHLAPTGGGVDRFYWLAIALRIGGVGWLLWVVWRDAGSGDDDAVECGGGEPHAHRDLLTDRRDARA